MLPVPRLSPRPAALVVVVLVVLALAPVLLHEERPVAAVRQDAPGHVLLVPGYGGDTVGLRVLAARLEREGRRTTVVQLPADGLGDLEDAALRLRAAADAALRGGARSVDVVGYSAGGVTARLWAAAGGAARARRVVTLGSPHHGTDVRALGDVFASGACPSACQELVPGSRLLRRLNAGDETPDGPQWMSVWTDSDTVVTPPDSARLEGAVEVVVQEVCPGKELDHGQLPHDPTVQLIVLQALSAQPLRAPGSEVCEQGPPTPAPGR